MGSQNPQKLATLPELADVNSDQEDNGAEMNLIYDRDTMARLGIDVQAANSLLNNAFGQRQISTIYQPMNQYKVVMEVDPRYTRDISALEKCSLSITKEKRSRCRISLNGNRRTLHCR